MLGLTLRKEFQGKRLKGTQIELRNSKKTGAVQQPAEDFLEITYPSGDVLKSLRALGKDQARPVVLMGSRGRGKSHLMAVLHHALTDHAATTKWLTAWGQRLGDPGLGEIGLPDGLHVISESLHEGNYKFLWDVVFDKHPRGDFYRGKWSEKKQRAATPSKELLIEMFQDTPTALLLDEYQIWYDGQIEEPSRPQRSWAFTFIQLLSEIANELPQCLRLVVSVRDGNTDAYQQIHRVGPLQVNFSGPGARQDRLRLLLHRLFQNRLQIADGDIDKLLQAHVGQYLHLFDVAADEHRATRQSFREAWPFSPHLMDLLEDQVLVATDTQETRDLLVILAGLYKSRGEQSPLITAADFDLLSESDEVAAHIESVASEQHRRLREVARRNLNAVKGAVPSWEHEIPLLEGVLTSLWLRSLAVGNAGGAEPRALQLDVTRRDVLDANKFSAQLEQIVENSFNIHKLGNRLVFKDEENPQARLLAEARNDRLFSDGSDYAELSKQIRYALAGGDGSTGDFALVVLGRNFELFQDLNGFQLEDYRPFADVSDSLRRLLAFLETAYQDEGRSVRVRSDDVYEWLDRAGSCGAVFTTNRDLAREREELSLLGLDHPLVEAAIARWSQLPPEQLGLAVEGEEPGVISWWKVELRGSQGESRSLLTALACRPDGQRMPQWERLGLSWFERTPTQPLASPEQRTAWLAHLEPMLHRDLEHKGMLTSTQGFSARLMGWVEIVQT